MKTLLTVVLILLSTTILAQRFNRPVTNNNLKEMIGVWNGTVYKTDTAYNNALLQLKSRVEIKADGDSLLLNFKYTDARGQLSAEISSFYVLHDSWMMRIDGEEYEITSMSRRGYTQVLVAERQAYENYKRMDFRVQISFAPNQLKIVKEARFMEMDAYFIRYRSFFTKNKID